MKNIKPEILLTNLFLTFTLISCSQPNTSTSSEGTAEISTLEYSVSEAQSQSLLQTPVDINPVATPLPTSTNFPVLPITPNPPSNVQLSGEILYDSEDGKAIIDLSNYHFYEPLHIEAKDYKTLNEGTWSEDGEYLAFATFLPPLSKDSRYTDVGICVFSKQDLLNEKKWITIGEDTKCIRVFTNIFKPWSVTQGNYLEIMNISWSPDNNYMLVVVKGIDTLQYNVTSPCLIEVDTNSVDCRWVNIFLSPGELFLGLLDIDVYKIVTGAHAISWSPKDENKLAIPLKTNWQPISDGIENGSTSSYVAPWDVSTDDLKQGLYLVDISIQSLFDISPPANDRSFSLLWEAPPNTTIDSDQLPLWTSDGSRIVFVYIDPWFNVERNMLYPNIPTANYTVGMIGEDGQNFQKLFDSTSMYLSGTLPSDANIPAIQIHRWLYQDRFILFTAQVYRSIEDKYKQSLFLYDTDTMQFFQLTTWVNID